MSKLEKISLITFNIPSFYDPTKKTFDCLIQWRHPFPPLTSLYFMQIALVSPLLILFFLF